MTRFRIIDILIKSNTKTIEVIIATVLLVFGLYVGSPALHEFPERSAELLTAGGQRWPMFVAYMVVSASVIMGVLFKCRVLREWGTLGAVFLYAFLTVFRWADNGPFSIPWVLTLAFALIAGICHLGVRFEAWNPRSLP